MWHTVNALHVSNDAAEPLISLFKTASVGMCSRSFDVPDFIRDPNSVAAPVDDLTSSSSLSPPATTISLSTGACKHNSSDRKCARLRKIATTEMRMLCGILGVLRQDHMRNEEIRSILHVSPIDEVMRCGLLRWFGHVQRRDADNVTRRVMNLAISGTRRRGRPMKMCHQHIKDDMTGVGVTQEVALGRTEWI